MANEIFDENACLWLSRRTDKKKIVYCPRDRTAWARDDKSEDWLQSPETIEVKSIVKAEEVGNRLILGWIDPRNK